LDTRSGDRDHEQTTAQSLTPENSSQDMHNTQSSYLSFVENMKVFDRTNSL